LQLGLRLIPEWVGTGYFDAVAEIVAGGDSSTTALEESTEAMQFR
jgi:isocitrate lyase